MPSSRPAGVFLAARRKLLALTRCLLRNPAVLFLDEPTVGMDNQEKFAILGMIRQAAKNHTVMVVDHDLRWLLPFCDYFIVLSEGKIAERGTGDELLARRGLFYDLYHADGAQPAEHSPAAVPLEFQHFLAVRKITRKIRQSYQSNRKQRRDRQRLVTPKEISKDLSPDRVMWR